MAFVDLRRARPNGRNYVPFVPQHMHIDKEKEAGGIESFNEKTEERFNAFQASQATRNSLTQADRAHAIRHILHPKGKLEGETSRERQHDAQLRYRYLSKYEIQEGQLYRKASGEYAARSAVTSASAFAILTAGHRLAGHQGPRKVHDYLDQFYYPITLRDCEWIRDNCLVCSLNAQNKSLPATKKIVSKGCLYRVQFDLMDFRISPDGVYKWIFQIKDHFSRYIWLYPLESKEAEPISRIVEQWLADNGFPDIMQCDNGVEFKAETREMIIERAIRVINSRPRHPQTNGSIEIANKSAKSVLRKFQLEFGTSEWKAFLPQIQLILNTSQSNILPKGLTPFKIWFGRPPAFIRPKLREIYDVETMEVRLEETGEEADGTEWVDFHEEDIEYERRLLTEVENRVHLRNEHTTKRYNKQNPPAEPFSIGELVTMKVSMSYRLKTESLRIPCRVLELEAKTGKYRLLSHKGLLKGWWPRHELNKAHHDISESAIPLQPGEKEKEISLNKAYELWYNRVSLNKLRTNATAKTAAENEAKKAAKFAAKANRQQGRPTADNRATVAESESLQQALNSSPMFHNRRLLTLSPDREIVTPSQIVPMGSIIASNPGLSRLRESSPTMPPTPTPGPILPPRLSRNVRGNTHGMAKAPAASKKPRKRNAPVTTAVDTEDGQNLGRGKRQKIPTRKG